MATTFQQQKSINKLKYRSKTSMGYRNNTEFKSAVRDEVAQYLKSKNVPIAAIDIHVDGCNPKTIPRNERDQINGSLKLDITTENMAMMENSSNNDPPQLSDHWMTWNDNTPSLQQQPQRYQTPQFKKASYSQTLPIKSRPQDWNHNAYCSSPFAPSIRPNTSWRDNSTSRPTTPYMAISNRDILYRRPATAMGMDKGTNIRNAKTTSVAVGPDKHYNEISTNTEKSYQLSDYLKKSMDLNDPYERKIYSSLMDVMRKKSRHDHSPDSIVSNSVIMPDTFAQISEYKARYRNPIALRKVSTGVSPADLDKDKSKYFTRNRTVVCTHRTPLVDEHRRPSTSAASKFRHGEQFLY